jgi:hypothetical protein
MVAVVATAAEPEAQKRDDPKTIRRIPIAIMRVSITIHRVSIARVIAIIVVVIVAVTKVPLLNRHVPTFFLTGPSLYTLK